MKFKKEKSFFVMHLLFFWFLPAFVFAGTAYYVDPNATGGGNGSYATPWRNVAQINGHTFSTGDDLYFKVNTTLEMPEKIIISWNGTATNRAIIGAYYGENQFGLRSGDQRPILRGSFYRDPDGPHVPSGDYDGLIDCGRNEARYITVQNLELLESYTGGIRIGSSGKERGDSVREIIIRNNIVRNAGGQGIALNHSINGLIENNLVDGACLRPGRNKKKPAAHSGAALVMMGGNRDYLSHHNVIRGNTVRRGFEMIGVYRGGLYTTIENNTIYDFTDNGVYVENAMYGTISGNLIYNTATVWWPPYQSEDKGIQAGVMVDSEGIMDHVQKGAGGFDIFDNRIAHAKWGIMLASRSAFEGTGHILSRVYNNRIVDSKESNIVMRKGSNDTMAQVRATWRDNFIYGNYSFIYGGAGEHAINDTWPGVSWGVEATRNTDWTLTATTTKKGNYYNTDHATVTGDPAKNAEFDKVALKKTTGWRDLAPGEVTKSWFEFAGEVLTPKPVVITNLRLE